MQPFGLKPIFAALSFTVFILFVGNASFAQGSSKIEITVGRLTADRSGDSVFQVKLGNKVLFESEVEYGSIKAAFPKRKPTIIVLSIGECRLTCAASFYVVDVSKSQPAISKGFGNCSPKAKITFRHQTLNVKFPDGSKIPAEDSGAYRYGAAETWTYRSGKLRKLN